MWTYNYSNELYHHGILGMKWGQRNGPPYPLCSSAHSLSEKRAGWQKSLSKVKEKENSYRQKLTNISENKNADVGDLRRIRYRNQNLSKRVTKMIASGVTQFCIGEIMSGQIEKYRLVSKQELTKYLIKKTCMLMGKTIANVAIEDALAKSTSNKYTNSGKRKKGSGDSLITKEDIIAMGIRTAVNASQFINIMMKTKSYRTYRQRLKNEELFNKWGKNILPEKVDHVVWQSDDLKVAIIDNRL